MGAGMITSSKIQLSSTDIQYLSKQEQSSGAKPVMILLHGFPENSWSWEHYIEVLSAEFKVFAPDLPGFNGSKGFPLSSDYTITNLVEVMAEFIRTVGKGEPVHLVAHDWGGVIAWPLVAFYEGLIDKLSILNAAHPAPFTREMAINPKQQANSDYISDLISEQAFVKTSDNDHYMLRRMYGGWFKKLSKRQQASLITQWSDQNTMEQTFAYYKNMPQLTTTRIKRNSELKIPNIRIYKPTQVLWGLRDTAFVPEVLNGMEQWVEQLEVHVFDDADHWLHHQKPEQIIAFLRQFHRPTK
jgi:pimeloyl-ACP methyl ester carboxylesterase